jgi:hypothetical protein
MNAPTSVRLKADPTTRRRRSSDELSPNCPRIRRRMAPQAGLEPATLRLTAGCSAIELLRNTVRCAERPPGTAAGATAGDHPGPLADPQ